MVKAVELPDYLKKQKSCLSPSRLNYLHNIAVSHAG